jgi:hypothetical protein
MYKKWGFSRLNASSCVKNIFMKNKFKIYKILRIFQNCVTPLSLENKIKTFPLKIKNIFFMERIKESKKAKNFFPIEMNSRSNL